MGKDYYKILGVEKSATKEQIKKAYKKLAKKYHPDLNKDADAEKKFKEINEAAAVLGDDEKRQRFDQFGTADFTGHGGQGFDFSDFARGGNFSFDFGDIFDQFFGGRSGRRRGPSRGPDLIYPLEITLDEVAFGGEKEILVPRKETCTKCKGSGAKSKSDIETCEACHGRGTATQTRRTPFGLFQTTGSCRDCGGQGKIIKEYCETCDGEGLLKKNRKIKVDIPKGVATGNKLRIAGEGEAGVQGGPRGDLYVAIHVLEHDLFERQREDIYIEIPISFVQAVFGGESEVPTLYGKVKMKIPASTQTNTLFNLRGKGLPSLQGYGKGDQKVRVIVQTPKKLNKKQKEILEKFAKAGGDVIQEKGFFSRLKDKF